MISPPALWQADDAPVVHIEAAFKTEKTEGAIGWTNYDPGNHNPDFKPENHRHFKIIGDGEFRTYEVDLSKAETYRGALSYLFVKPALQPEEGGWVKIKRIHLGK